MEKKYPVTPEEKNAQIRREAKATFVLFLICAAWHIGWALALTGGGLKVFGLPLWWLLSTPGVFVVAVIGLAYLLRHVFVDFDLDDEEVQE